MMMLDQLTQRAHDYFQEQLGVSFDALIDPIDTSMPTGKSVRGNGVYNAIEQARRQDDASLPLGAWDRDLKRADWDKVSAVAVDALVNKSKDLQLAGWLLEAQINKTGFAGIAACMMLMKTLCERYWEELYPQAEDGDLEYRANIIHWINEKLLPALRMVPVTATGRERDYSWADWELARRNEQVRASNGGRDHPQIEGVTVSEMLAAMGATSTDSYMGLHQLLIEALEAIETLTDTLDQQFGKEAPSLMTLAGLLEQILSLAESELHKRGVRPALPSEEELVTEELPIPAAGPDDIRVPQTTGAIRDRADAYARLIEVADFLMRLEPHSPAPYLVRRATEWGRLNTVELYQELFLKLGGQLNIFEMLGLEQRPSEGRAG
jgi:type VI secretion system protein ImpA